MICLKNILNLKRLLFWQKKICEAKDKKKNDELVALIKIRWSNLRDEIEKMSKKEIENEKPDKILKIAKEILKFNKQKQLGQGLKILTPDQMLNRLPITLAQIKAANNSKKLKNEISCILYCTIQLLYSLYRSKKLTK